MIQFNLDDRYETIRTLHQSAATAVLLVRHKKIGALRILKAISKASPDAISILSEAHLLQGINSSLIPTIYEVEETEEFYYLIEEYIEGVSLREYLLSTKIKREELIKLSIELCEILEVLHTWGQEPVLYRDMKPEHLIIQNDKLRLIDFGIAMTKSEEAPVPFGTPGFAAPEQLKGQLLDERCDIYGVGKVIEFMQKNSYAKDDYKLKYIISKATEENMYERTDNILILKHQLESLLGSNENENNEKKHLEKIIAVVGETRGVGVTHIAISLCQFFNERKTEAYYVDKKDNTVNELWKNLKGAKLKAGILYHNSFRGLMNYGPSVKQYKPPKGLKIIDYGTDTKNVVLEADIIIYVTSGCPWKDVSNMPEWINAKNVIVINNFSNRIISLKSAKDIQKRVYLYPIVKRTLRLTRDEERLFLAIIKNEKGHI